MRTRTRSAFPSIFVALSVIAVEACTSDESPILELGVPDAGINVGGPDSSTAADGGHVVDSGGTDSTVQPVDTGIDSTMPDAPEEDVVVVDASDDAAPDVADAGVDAEVDANDGGVDAADAAIPPGALLFDGVNDHITVSLADGGVSETAFTVELWFKTTTATTTFFEIAGTSGGADRFIFLSAGKFCFYVYGPPITVCSTAATYADGAWHHGAATIGTLGSNIYVDGVLAGTNAKTSSTFTGDNIIFIGYGHIGFVSATNYYKGKLDEVRVWNVERTAIEIAANYNQHIAANTAGLMAYWKLDESGSTATAADETGAFSSALLNFTFTPSPWQGPGAF